MNNTPQTLADASVVAVIFLNVVASARALLSADPRRGRGQIRATPVFATLPVVSSLRRHALCEGCSAHQSGLDGGGGVLHRAAMADTVKTSERYVCPTADPFQRVMLTQRIPLHDPHV